MVNNLDQNILKIQAAVLVSIAPWKSSRDKKKISSVCDYTRSSAWDLTRSSVWDRTALVYS